MKRSLAFLAVFLCSAAALAATRPKLGSLEGDVRVGKEGSWRSAAKDMEIAEDEFVSIAAGAKATVAMPDGKQLPFTGKRIVAGRRLAKTGAGTDVFFSEAVRAASGAIAGEEKTSTTPGGMKNCSDADRKLGKCSSKAMGFESEEDDARTAVAASQAHYVLGGIAANEGNFETAIRELSAAAVPAAPADLRAKALVARARVEIDLGDTKTATADLEQARSLEQGTSSAHAAAFLLAALALENGDRKR